MEVFGGLRNVVLEENEEDTMVWESSLTYRREEDSSCIEKPIGVDIFWEKKYTSWCCQWKTYDENKNIGRKTQHLDDLINRRTYWDLREETEVWNPSLSHEHLKEIQATFHKFMNLIIGSTLNNNTSISNNNINNNFIYVQNISVCTSCCAWSCFFFLLHSSLSIHSMLLLPFSLIHLCVMFLSKHVFRVWGC